MGLGSGIRKNPNPDPGSRGQKGTASRIPDPDPQHWFKCGLESMSCWCLSAVSLQRSRNISSTVPATKNLNKKDTYSFELEMTVPVPPNSTYI
jgi:hypothetical protein